MIRACEGVSDRRQCQVKKDGQPCEADATYLVFTDHLVDPEDHTVYTCDDHLNLACIQVEDTGGDAHIRPHTPVPYVPNPWFDRIRGGPSR